MRRSRWLLAGLLLLAGCAAPVVPPVPPPARPAPPTVADVEADVHARINAHREARALPPLQVDSLLVRLARAHSTAMAAGHRPFSHDGFNERAQAIRAALPVNTVSENVATSTYPPGRLAPVVVEGWLESPGHRQNLEGDFVLTGVGIAYNGAGRYYVTQLFADARLR